MPSPDYTNSYAGRNSSYSLDDSARLDNLRAERYQNILNILKDHGIEGLAKTLAENEQSLFAELIRQNPYILYKYDVTNDKFTSGGREAESLFHQDLDGYEMLAIFQKLQQALVMNLDQVGITVSPDRDGTGRHYIHVAFGNSASNTVECAAIEFVGTEEQLLAFVAYLSGVPENAINFNEPILLDSLDLSPEAIIKAALYAFQQSEKDAGAQDLLNRYQKMGSLEDYRREHFSSLKNLEEQYLDVLKNLSPDQLANFIKDYVENRLKAGHSREVDLEDPEIVLGRLRNKYLENSSFQSEWVSLVNKDLDFNEGQLFIKGSYEKINYDFQGKRVLEDMYAIKESVLKGIEMQASKQQIENASLIYGRQAVSEQALKDDHTIKIGMHSLDNTSHYIFGKGEMDEDIKLRRAKELKDANLISSQAKENNYRATSISIDFPIPFIAAAATSPLLSGQISTVETALPLPKLRFMKFKDLNESRKVLKNEARENREIISGMKEIARDLLFNELVKDVLLTESQVVKSEELKQEKNTDKYMNSAGFVVSHSPNAAVFKEESHVCELSNAELQDTEIFNSESLADATGVSQELLLTAAIELDNQQISNPLSTDNLEIEEANPISVHNEKVDQMHVLEEEIEEQHFEQVVQVEINKVSQELAAENITVDEMQLLHGETFSASKMDISSEKLLTEEVIYQDKVELKVGERTTYAGNEELSLFSEDISVTEKVVAENKIIEVENINQENSAELSKSALLFSSDTEEMLVTDLDKSERATQEILNEGESVKPILAEEAELLESKEASEEFENITSLTKLEVGEEDQVLESKIEEGLKVENKKSVSRKLKSASLKVVQEGTSSERQLIKPEMGSLGEFQDNKKNNDTLSQREESPKRKTIEELRAETAKQIQKARELRAQANVKAKNEIDDNLSQIQIDNQIFLAVAKQQKINNLNTELEKLVEDFMNKNRLAYSFKNSLLLKVDTAAKANFSISEIKEILNKWLIEFNKMQYSSANASF